MNFQIIIEYLKSKKKKLFSKIKKKKGKVLMI